LGKGKKPSLGGIQVLKKTRVLLVAMILLLACSNKPKSNEVASYHKLTAEAAKEMMDEEKDYILLDVRTKEEFQEVRIEGAILLPYDEIGAQASTVLPDKAVLIFVYCRSGRRSEIAAEELVKLGYSRVYDIGGITSWPYATVSD
jgi:rhodanese-related sulfurtransferase